MKIAIADNNSKKFSQDLIEHWSKKHEVRYEAGASEHLAQWANLYYCDDWDNNVNYLYRLYTGKADPENYPSTWDNNKKPIIVVRPLDWTVWLGYCRDQQQIDWIDKVICIAPHIEKELKDHANFGNKLKLIRPGVNLDKFTLKTKETDGFQLGMVLGDMWKYKNHMGGLDIFTTLYRQDSRWRFHVRGQQENQNFDPINWDYYLQSRGIKEVVTLYAYTEDMNIWLENIDILLHPGQKEAFCYAVGEAMAKGIRPVVNDFYGSRDIWPEELIYQTHEEALKMMKPADFPTELREFMEMKYSNERMFREIDEYLGT